MADESPGTSRRGRALPDSRFTQRQLLAREQMAGPAVEWIGACYRLTPRVERTGTWSALLDLGICTDAEARAALDDLAGRLATLQLHVRIGIGASGVLAQVVALGCTSPRPVRLLAPEDAPAFLRCVPVGALPQLHPQGAVTPEVVARLQRYGLRTLGHISRLGELALRRQFGAVGSFLAAVAQGRDVRPLCPTPLPAALRFRQRFPSPALPDEVLALLPHLSERIAGQLRAQGRMTRALRLCVRWENGRVERARLTLRQYTDTASPLAHALRHMLTPLLMPPYPSGLSEAATPYHDGWDAPTIDGADMTDPTDGSEERPGDRIEDLHVTLGDFAPAAPAQATFWRTREQRLASLREAAETLARRHGRPLLLHPRVITPAAVFSEDRYALADSRDERSDPPPTATERMSSEASPSRLSHVDHMDHMEHTDTASAADAWHDVPQRLHWW